MVKIIGHRGHSSIAPENTLSSFRLALEDPMIDMIECDVHISRDGYFIVSHDYTIDRTSNGMGYIAEMTYDELKKYDCGSWFSEAYIGETYSLLTDVIALVGGKKPLVIELKREGRYYPEMAKQLIDTLSVVSDKDNLYIKSFDHELIAEISKLSTAYRLGLLYYSRPIMLLEQLKACKCQFVSLYGGALSELIIKQCHEASIEVMTWTIDREEEIRAIWRASSLIGIITNRPEVATDIKESWQSERDR